jgi:hypothetical protein
MNKAFVVVAVAFYFLAPCGPAVGQVLVGDPFTHTTQGWVDAYPTTRLGNWRLNLLQPTLMDTNNANPPTSGATNHAGTYEPDVLVKDTFVAPASYEYTARMRTNDDDIVGIVWNYQDPNNYFRAGIRTQAAGTFGGTQGVSIQKIVGGALTQIAPAVVGPGAATPITQAMINNRTPFDMKVVVNGSSYDLQVNGASIYSGMDADLVTGRKIGFQSWAQLSDTDENPDPLFYGTEIESATVTSGGNTLFSESFAARPQKWRQVVMSNSAGDTATSATKGDLGNFGIGVNNPWVFQNSNGFRNATGGSVDFIGPGVAIDDPGVTNLSDYKMQVRLGTNDDDGLGVLVRVQDDDNFYRVTFAKQAVDAGGTRAPSGLSVQKVRNGVWTELFRDNQTTPLFVYPQAAANTNPSTAGFPTFDLTVLVIGNTLDIQVIDNLGNVINYPLIVDSANPLLAGSVGFHTWGQGDNGGAYYMAYGGQSTPLLVAIPEPGTWLLAIAGAAAMAHRRRSSRDVRVKRLVTGGGLHDARRS